MKKTVIVIDTCVLVSALRSKRGASFLLLSRIDSDNASDFNGAERFGIKVVTPKEFLIKKGVIKP